MKRIVLAITILLVIGAASRAHASQISLRPTHVGGQISNPTFYPIAHYDVGNIAAIQSPAGWNAREAYMEDFFAAKKDPTSGVIHAHFRVPSNAGGLSNTTPLTFAAIRDINVAMGGYFGKGIGHGQNVKGFSLPSEGGSAFFDDGRDEMPLSAPLPEPAALLLLGIALIAAGSLGRVKQWPSWKKMKSIVKPATLKPSIRTTVFRIE